MTPPCKRTVALFLVGALLHTAWPNQPTFAQGPPRVSFELLLEDPYKQRDAERWHQMMDRISGVSVRIRSGRAGEKTGIDEISGGFRVVGILNARNQLELPGGKFTLQEGEKLEGWIGKLRNGGVENLASPRIAFGLTPKQLTEIHTKLEHVVVSSTKGKTVAQAAKLIATEAGLALQSDPAARGGASEVVDNEAKGLAAGAALALVLRPGGLVLTIEPIKYGSDVVLRIRRGSDVKEFWPVGWPVQGAIGQLAPDMFKRLNVEINNTPLSEALDAVGQRLSTPLLVDMNSLASEGVDPTTLLVSHPAGSSYYKRIIDRMLTQGKLSGRWRQDEAGKVFYWITTSKQAMKEETTSRDK